MDSRDSAATLPTVSVVIPTYNRRGYIERVVRPLLDDDAALEIIVVVDGCADGTHELLLELSEQHPRLRPVWQVNAGAGQAREAGLQRAKGEVVLVLDDDVVASPGLVSAHAAAHVGRTRLVVVGYMPPVLPVPRKPDQAPTYIYASDYERVCRAYERQPQQILLNLWAGNLSLRREDAVEVGMSDGASLGYHADKAFGYRCFEAGLRGSFSRQLRATHLHHRSLARFRAELQWQAVDRRQLAVTHAETDDQGWLVWRPAGLSARFLKLLRFPRIYPAASALLVALYRLAGRVRAWPVETVVARIIRQIDLEYHARQKPKTTLSQHFSG